jgi:Flp pilus assembly CpaE family ATPase
MRSSPASARRGPLLAVCGLCGGAGASTLAYLTALAAARRDERAMLVADTGGPTAGISHYAGVRAPRSLTEAAEHVNAGLSTGELVARTADGLRVLATSPTLTQTCSREGVELLLEQARERYALTVIDCGTLAREADQIALASATHVVWVLPATAGAAIRGRQLLDAIAPHQSGREILTARHEPRDRRRALRELRDLARHRRAVLILLPRVPDLATGNADAALETAQVPLQAILGALGR